MISEAIVKKEFIRQILKRDSSYIKEVQAQVIQDAGLVKSGALLSDIRNQSGAKIAQGEGMHMLTVTFLKYLRFIDIKSSLKASKQKKINISNNYEKRHKEMPLRRNLTIYNKVIFGRLYNETRRDISYAYTDEIRQKITEQLEAAGYKK